MLGPQVAELFMGYGLVGGGVSLGGWALKFQKPKLINSSVGVLSYDVSSQR